MAEAIGYLILAGLGELGVAAAGAEAALIAAGTGTTIIAGLTVGTAVGSVAILGDARVDQSRVLRSGKRPRPRHRRRRRGRPA